MKDNVLKDIDGDKITKMAKSILNKSQVNDGGHAYDAIINIFDILFPKGKLPYVQIYVDRDIIDNPPKGYILDHVVIGVNIKDNPSGFSHAVLGTYCYEDKKPNPIIVDSNRPYNPFYIDWKNPKNKETILEYFKSVYNINPKSVFEIGYRYTCYVNIQKLAESKKFINRPENQAILNICTAYSK